MAVCQLFPDTVEEWMEEYKIVDTEHVYTNGAELVPIFRMKQWLQHERSLYPKQKWIPCSERLPEEKGEYLVTYHPCYWDEVKQDIKVGIDSFRGKTAWAKKKHQRVIAWMPLPEPYKGEEP